MGQGQASPFNPIKSIAGAKLSVRGNVLINNYPIPVNISGGSDPNPETYYVPHLVADSTVIQPVLSRADLERLEGTTPVANETFVATVIDLYVADPEGMTNGIATGNPALPNGFVQGIQYLHSFVDNSADDLDRTAGSFAFDVRGLRLGGGAYAITANYLQSPPGTHNEKAVTSPFSEPVQVGFVPGGIQSAGLARIVPDTIVFEKADTANLDNWEPFASVLGTNVFLIEANAHAINADPEDLTPRQRYRVAFQRASGGPVVQSDGFYSDAGQPFTGRINFSRENGNPGRVAGDARPGAVNFLVGGEASPHVIDAFRSNNRWDLGFDRKTDGRYATIQSFALNLNTLVQTPLTTALDPIHGRLDGSAPAPPGNQISRFGGDITYLDNGNILVVVDDRSGVLGPAGGATLAVVLSPSGQVLKETFLVEPRDTWSNIGAFKGGFVIRSHERLFFYDNTGELKASASTRDAGLGIDEGRGDGIRISSHIHGNYVFLAGAAGGRGILAVWDARDGSYLGHTLFAEAGMTPVYDRTNLDVDALNRVAVAYEAKPTTEYAQFQTLVRVFHFDTECNSFTPLTPSFFAFANNATTGIRTIRPSVAMTTQAILVAAKGEINRENTPEGGANTPTQTTFFTVFSHPTPALDPTPAVVGGNDEVRLSVVRNGNSVVLSWPSTAVGFVLESSPTVVNPTWTAVGGGNPATVSTAGAAQYFRLRK